jgi:AAA15 family ATPase/GTPase
MLTEFQITNFKAFSGPETLPIRPLTLIFGPNSSGKSSIFQCLLMLKQTIESADAKTNLLIKGDLVDLGSYREFIHRHETNRTFSFRVMVKSGYGTPDIDEIDRLLKYDDDDYEDYIDELVSSYNSLGLSITFTYDNSKKRTSILSWELVLQAPPIPDNDLGDSDLDDLDIILDDFNDYEEPLMKNDKAKEEKSQIKNFDHFLPPHTNDDLWFSYKDDKTDADYLLTRCAALGIERALKSILHIGPMREYPERYFSFSGNQTDYVGKSGKFVPDILIADKIADQKLLRRVNYWFSRLKIGYELKVPSLSDPEAEVHDLFALRLCNKTGVNVGLTDVGFGLSQVLPVIVQSVASKNKIILIEQPEYHLHPKLQAELGDMFIETALGGQGNTFLIETHSEHLILRILRRIRETAEGTLPEGVTPIKPEDVAVVYVQPGEQGSRIICIPTNEEGEFEEPWPEGFFPERAEELF